MQKADLSYDEVHAVLCLADALLDEGPVSGISNLDDPKGFLAEILKKSKGDYPFSERDLRILKDISEWGDPE